MPATKLKLEVTSSGKGPRLLRVKAGSWSWTLPVGVGDWTPELVEKLARSQPNLFQAETPHTPPLGEIIAIL